MEWPTELLRFLERPSPLFMHVAAVQKGAAPFTCRCYGVLDRMPEGRVEAYILKSQWFRLQPYLESGRWLALLLTSGLDNESYQLKGVYASHRGLTDEDDAIIERQRRLVAEHFPQMAALAKPMEAGFAAVSIDVSAVYRQTPGPEAGTLLAGRSM